MFTPETMLKSKLLNPEYVKLDAKYITDEVAKTEPSGSDEDHSTD